MKKTFAAILATVIALFMLVILAGCQRAGSSMTGNGKIVDQTIKATDFTSINIRGAFNAEILQSDNFAVIVSTDENLLNRIIVSTEGETLNFKIEAPANFFPTSLKIRIMLPRIYRLTLSEKAHAAISGFQSTFNFRLNMDGESELTGDLEAGICDFTVSGASKLNLKGKALELKLLASGKSKMDLKQFEVKKARVTFKESSEATMNINGRIDVSLADASKIYYVGEPVIYDANISGGSIMQPK
ncbi:MAG: DUF2807 domain-containing protein [Dehalococcoidales bacterium]|jgi:hypothetical protein|nr:DUF2807 domain-containing protein [Dehalococcoidales bacterium]